MEKWPPNGCVSLLTNLMLTLLMVCTETDVLTTVSQEKYTLYFLQLCQVLINLNFIT